MSEFPVAPVPLESRHLPGALKLSQEVAWPYRLEDWRFALATGEGLVIERAGAVIGTAMWWKYGKRFATTGMIIVTPAMQGAGYGARLFDGVLAATQGYDVLLHATREGLSLYQRRGFTAFGEVVQHRGVPRLAASAQAHEQAHENVRPAIPVDLDAITALDEEASGLPRSALIAALANVGDVRVVTKAGRVTGYAIAREFGLGYVIGPVVGETIEDARLLIEAHLPALAGRIVRIDIDAQDGDAQGGLGDWLTELGLEPHSRVTAMVLGRRPARDGRARLFALANQSMG
jgi:predicted GNAT family N-acyltransferase